MKNGIEVPDCENCLLKAESVLWAAVIGQSDSGEDETLVVLQTIRASLDAARRLRFAGDVTEDERQRLVFDVSEAAAVQEQKLILWSVRRGLRVSGRFSTPTSEGFPHCCPAFISGIITCRVAARFKQVSTTV